MHTILFIAGLLLGAFVTFIFCRDIIRDLKAKLDIAEAELEIVEAELNAKKKEIIGNFFSATTIAADRTKGRHLTLSYHDITPQCIKNRGIDGCIDYVADELKNTFHQQLEKGFSPDAKFQVIFKKI